MISFLAAILIDFFFALVKSSCVALLILLNEKRWKKAFRLYFSPPPFGQQPRASDPSAGLASKQKKQQEGRQEKAKQMLDK